MMLRFLRAFALAAPLLCGAAMGCNALLDNGEHRLPGAEPADATTTSDGAHPATGGMDDASQSASDVATSDDASPSNDAEPAGDGAEAVDGAPKAGDGADCSADSDCATNHCADGVCCDTSCSGSCQQCNLAGYKGTCSPAPVGVAPPAMHPACQPSSESSCGQDGNCDGRGACELWPNGTTCGGGSCDASANTSVSGSTCNGTGQCVAASAVTCAPFKCSGTACARTCAGNGDCVGQPCVSSSCGTVANGTACTAPAQCTSGNCVDGYCCDLACSGSCQACDVASAQGKCTTVTTGQPHGARGACTGSGTCQGSCTGASTACTYPTVSCAAASCSSGIVHSPSSCNGAGACAAQAQVSCNGFACNGAACYTSCSGDGQCGSLPYCSSGSCSSTAPLGHTCSGGTQCGTGNCVNSVCCSTASCTASDACHTAGTCSAPTGTCSNPTASDGKSCGNNEVCTSGSCGCSSGFTSCPSGCVNESSDVQNCGGCAMACPALNVTSPVNTDTLACSSQPTPQGPAPECVVQLGLTAFNGPTVINFPLSTTGGAFPVSVPRTITVTEVVTGIGSANGIAFWALYSDGGGVPGSVILQGTSEGAPNGTGGQFVSPTQIGAGTYWLAATNVALQEAGSAGPYVTAAVNGGTGFPQTWPSQSTSTSGQLWVEYLVGTE